jgi:hypothetical protein
LPNPWQTKARGKIIRNVPITLYSDDTSGNVSKQCNEHVSFYFTLSGLQPRLSNKEFNCHFLTTSNQAGVLKLSEMVIDELKYICPFSQSECALIFFTVPSQQTAVKVTMSQYHSQF